MLERWRAVEAEDDRDRVARGLVAQEPRLGAVQRDAQGPRDDLGRDAGPGRLLAVDDELDLRALVLDEPVDVDDAGVSSKIFLTWPARPIRFSMSGP